ncbi:MAG: BatD family protein [Gemmatimonadetes bacterium]|nr:BatD family protein [Gemmatimonadota bacterium]NNK47597.1 hypothetical protein [Gemmatimonadota bacterium]
MSRNGRAGFVAACLLACLAGGASPSQAQQGSGRGAAGPRGAAALSPDTVRVGDPFTLGVSIAGAQDATVQFPPLLTLGAELEQLRPVDTEWQSEGGGQWRARYRLAAWKAGTWDIPDLRIEWQGSEVSLTPPPIHVTSVLPSASEGPIPLDGPRGPNRIRGFPWWLLLLLLALLLLWWLLRRLRRTEEAEVEEAWRDPAVDAREALARLKRDLEGGEVDLAAFYDGLEEALRKYLAARRGWPRERPVREFVDGVTEKRRLEDVEAGLRSLQSRSGLVRFAHIEAAETMALSDADACLAWVDAEEAEAA